jgi:hypothetical protein
VVGHLLAQRPALQGRGTQWLGGTHLAPRV